MQKFFVTSTGTEIGKTLVTAALTHQLIESGYKVAAVKPIISGFYEDDVNDTTILLNSQRLKVTEKNIDACSPWRFTAPISPDLAAALEYRKIDFNELEEFCIDSCKGSDYGFVEGVGGVMVPINENKNILDLISHLKLPTILVVGSYLGTISHTLTALKALEYAGVENVRIIISESEDNPMSIHETKGAIARFTKHPIHILRRIKSGHFADAEDITKLVL